MDTATPRWHTRAMVEETHKPRAGNGPAAAPAAKPETEEVPLEPEPTPENNSAGWFDLDMLRAVMSGAAATVVGATIIGLAAFVWGYVAEWRALPADTWPDFAGAAGAALETVKGWQLLLVGLFAFVSLMAAVSRQARYVLERDRADQDRQRKSLAAALQAEIQYLGELCKLWVESIKSFLPEGEKFFEVAEHRREEWKVGGMIIYESNGARIGLLPTETARLVVWFYSRFAIHNQLVSGGVIGKNVQRTLQRNATLAEEAAAALQKVIDGKFDY